MDRSGVSHPDDEALTAYLTPLQGDANERARLEAHLQQCDRCVALLVIARARLAVAAEAAVALPPGLLERATQLARAVEEPERAAPARGVAERPRPGSWLVGFRDRLATWARLPVLVPASFAVGVAIMLIADQAVLRSGMNAPARRSVSLVQTLRVTTAGAAMRAEPHGQATIVATLARGAAVTVDREDHGWYRARLSDGREGWVEQRAFE